MNQSQRNFLIKKIKETVDTRIQNLERSVPDAPSLNNWLLHAVLSNNFQIKNTEELKEIIRQKALNSKDREDWLGNHWGSANKNGVNFRAEEFFIVPPEYSVKAKDYQETRAKIQKEICDLRVQSDTLITRIQLASDKVLQTMINEVDDMGNISLLDTKIKLLSQ